MTKTKFRIDSILAAAVGIAAFVLLCIWPFEGMHPYVRDDVAIAAGLVPQAKMLPGLGVYLASLLFMALPYGVALTVNAIVAKAMMAAAAMLAFGAFAGMLEFVSGTGARDVRRRKAAANIAALAGSLLFAFSDPVWRAAQGMGSSTFVIFLVVLSCRLFVSTLKTASVASAIASLCAVAVLCAETPIGWPMLVFFVVVTNLYLSREKSEDWMRFLNPVRMQKVKWSLTFVFIGAFFAGIVAEMFAFAMLDGMRASGTTIGELPSLYVKAYGDLAVGAGTLPGVALFTALALIPYVLSFLTVGAATDEDRYLSFKNSLVCFIAGLAAFLQLAPFSFAWFWSMAGSGSVSGDLSLFGVFLDSATMALGLFVLCVEILCRDYRHIENVLYRSYRDDDSVSAAGETAGRENVRSVRLTFGRAALLAVPFALVAVAAYGRRLPEDRALQSIMADFVAETIEEAAGAKYLFTDGSFDSWLRIEAKRRGIDLAPVSLMSGSSRRDAYIRQLGSEGFEDRMTLEAGAAEALRTWVLAKSERMAEVSVQLAFEMFRLNRRLTPVVYGLLVRPVNGDPEAAAGSVARCHALAERIIAAHEDGTWRHAHDARLKDLFLFAQFRLAVMSRLRAINLDARKMVKESIEEISYSDRLNMNNPSLARILKRMDWIRRQSGEALTPREGLEVALRRADFVMARRYALPVLKEDPDEPNANFAVGMSYYAEEQFAKAEEYLKRVLKKKPDEPAVYNNIALICLKTGRLEEAMENGRKALELCPDRVEIKDTILQIEKAKSERKKPF